MKTWGREVWNEKSIHHKPHEVVHGTGATYSAVLKDTSRWMAVIDEIFCQRLPPGAEILDAGIGPLARFSLEFLKMGFTVTGLDISEACLDKARTKLVREGFPKTTLIEGDILNLPFTETFDAIFCSETFYHLPSYLSLRAMENFNRSLRLGGVLFIKFAVQEKNELLPMVKELAYLMFYKVLSPVVKRLGRKVFFVTVAQHAASEIEEMAHLAGFDILERRGEAFVFRKKIRCD